jgi:glutaconate CoA-transferase, subunit B
MSDQLSADGEYTTDEMMTVAASRELRDGAVCFVGIGLPSEAANLARATHAPNCVLIYESGTIGAKPDVLPLSIGDGVLAERADSVVSVPEIFNYWLQAGRIDVGFLGGAQVDRYGNINSTVIGPYRRPKVRLPGSGGANDIASMARRFVIIARHDRRRLVESLSYLTTPGFLDGPGARERAGLPGGGPVRIITDLAILGFDPKTKAARVEALYPGVDPEDVRANTGFELDIPADAAQAPSPGATHLRLLREVIDPKGIYTRPPAAERGR